MSRQNGTLRSYTCLFPWRSVASLVLSSAPATIVVLLLSPSGSLVDACLTWYAHDCRLTTAMQFVCSYCSRGSSYSRQLGQPRHGADSRSRPRHYGLALST